jgi:hypothetical protein
MAIDPEDAFPPFSTYDRSTNEIDTFVRFTENAYLLSWHLMELNPRDSLPKRPTPKPQDLLSNASYTPADTVVKDVELVCEWVTYEEYCTREKLEIRMVAEAAERGEYGPIKRQPNTDEPIILWPPSSQQDPKAQDLEPDKKSFRVTAERTMVVSDDLEIGQKENAEAVQDTLLSLAHAYGPDETSRSRALKTLFSSGLLLQWTAFEEFLRDTVAYMLRKHPTKISDKKKSVSYEELVALTQEFGSIEALQDALIQKEIDLLRAGGQSVQGLINFLKREFCLEKDPYAVTYIFAGQRLENGFADLLEVKDLRNVIAHNGAAESPIPDDEDLDAMYLRSRLLMRSIAYSISRSVSDEKYVAG